jgi:tetratricopeptide (TPR) repeat protein
MPNSAEDFDQALNGDATWEAALGIPSGVLEVYAVLGAQYYEQGLVADARAMFNAVITLNHRSHLGYAGLGALELRDGNPDLALQHLEQAYARDPSDLVVCGNLGEVLVLLGRRDEAARYLKESAALDPNETNPYANRARAILAALAA